MKTKMILGTLLATTVLQTGSLSYASDAGTIIGGIVGGLAGSSIGKGNGKTAATIIGAVAGAAVGSQANFGDNRHDDRFDDRRDDRWGRPGRYPGRPYPPHRPPPYRPPAPPPPPPAPYPGQNQASVQINSVPRRAGGTWYRLTLQQPLAVSNVEVRVLRANLKLHEAALVTTRNERIQIYELTNTPVLAYGQIAGAYINRNDRVVAIDIRAESFGDFADIAVSVGSPEGYPYLQVTQF